MSQAAYPATSDLAAFLDGAGFSLMTTVAIGQAGTLQVVDSTAGMHVGDSLLFHTAGQTRTIISLLTQPTNQVTLNATVTTVNNEVVFVLPSSLNLVGGIAAGIARFEREAGRVMLAGTAVARTFDPPTNRDSILDLKADLAALVSVTYNNAAQVTGSDYRTLPQDAPAEVKPWNRLQFSKKWWSPITVGQWGQIIVTGQWGYGLTIPDDAWEAMIIAAAIERLPQIITALNGGLVEWKEADITESYGAQPFAYLQNMWWDLYEATVNRYRRVTVGL